MSEKAAKSEVPGDFLFENRSVVHDRHENTFFRSQLVTKRYEALLPETQHVTKNTKTIQVHTGTL